MMSRPRTRWSTTVGDTRRSHQSEPAVYRWITEQAEEWRTADPETRHEQQFVTVWVDERLGRGWQSVDIVDLERWTLTSWSGVSWSLPRRSPAGERP